MNEKSGCFSETKKDPNECECSCHKTGGIHCVECCDTCPDCGKHIRFDCIEAHKKDCPGPIAGLAKNLGHSYRDDLDECDCKCHTNEALKIEHNFPCCGQCPFCGKRIKIGCIEKHKKNCQK